MNGLPRAMVQGFEHMTLRGVIGDLFDPERGAPEYVAILPIRIGPVPLHVLGPPSSTVTTSGVFESPAVHKMCLPFVGLRIIQDGISGLLGIAC